MNSVVLNANDVVCPSKAVVSKQNVVVSEEIEGGLAANDVASFSNDVDLKANDVVPFPNAIVIEETDAGLAANDVDSFSNDVDLKANNVVSKSIDVVRFPNDGVSKQNDVDCEVSDGGLRPNARIWEATDIGSRAIRDERLSATPFAQSPAAFDASSSGGVRQCSACDRHVTTECGDKSHPMRRSRVAIGSTSARDALRGPDQPHVADQRNRYSGFGFTIPKQ